MVCALSAETDSAIAKQRRSDKKVRFMGIETTSGCCSIVGVFIMTSLWSWVVAAMDFESEEQLHRIAAPHRNSHPSKSGLGGAPGGHPRGTRVRPKRRPLEYNRHLTLYTHCGSESSVTLL